MSTSGAKRALMVSGLAVLALATVGLSAFALMQDRFTAAAEPGRQVSSPSSSTSESTPEPEVGETPEPEPEPVALNPVTRFLEFGSTDHLVRGAIGSCPEPAGSAQVSFDGGASWEPSHAENLGAVQFMGVSIGDGGYVEMVVRDASCAPVLLRSFIGGVAWEQAPGEVDARWLFTPDVPGEIHAPSGVRKAPCEAVQFSLSASQATAAVLCRDASVLTSVDGGETWSTAVAVPGALAIAGEDTGVVVATTGAEGCAGVQLMSIVDGVSAVQGSCVELPAVGGEVAVAVSGGEIALWAGDVFVRSSDGGSTWA